MVQKILACVDGSAPSLQAARAAADLARSQGADLTFLHVCQLPVALATFSGAPVLPPDVLERYRCDLNEAVRERTLSAIRESGMTPRFLQEQGHPVTLILQTARDGMFDLVVVGSRGLTREQGPYLGSVSEAVAHQAFCPVLIVR